MIVSTNFDVPATMESGPSKLEVVANGIASKAVNVTVSGSRSRNQLASQAARLRSEAPAVREAVLYGRRRLAAGDRGRVEVLTLPVAVSDDLPSDRDAARVLIVQRGGIVDHDLLIRLLQRHEMALDGDDRPGNDFVLIVSARAVAVRGPSVALPASAVAVDIGRRAGRRRSSLRACNRAAREAPPAAVRIVKRAFIDSLFPSSRVLTASGRPPAEQRTESRRAAAARSKRARVPRPNGRARSRAIVLPANHATPKIKS